MSAGNIYLCGVEKVYLLHDTCHHKQRVQNPKKRCHELIHNAWFWNLNYHLNNNTMTLQINTVWSIANLLHISTFSHCFRSQSLANNSMSLIHMLFSSPLPSLTISTEYRCTKSCVVDKLYYLLSQLYLIHNHLHGQIHTGMRREQLQNVKLT